jgi:hypothetical protein
MKPMRDAASNDRFVIGRTSDSRFGRFSADDRFVRSAEFAGAPRLTPNSTLTCAFVRGGSTERSVQDPLRSRIRTVDDSSATDPAAGESAPSRGLERFLLWIDAVGGYFVTTRNEAILGQAHGSTGIDYPIQADLRPRHARIFRRDGDWFVEPVQNASGPAPIFVEGRKIDAPVHLGDGDELLLGESTLLRFRQPHPYSASATVEIVSRHRTSPHTDGLLLLAETAVLGPDWNSHIVCRRFADKLVLIARGGALRLRGSGPIYRDRQRFDDVCELNGDCRVTGEGFSMSLETLAAEDAA